MYGKCNHQVSALKWRNLLLLLWNICLVPYFIAFKVKTECWMYWGKYLERTQVFFIQICFVRESCRTKFSANVSFFIFRRSQNFPQSFLRFFVTIDCYQNIFLYMPTPRLSCVCFFALVVLTPEKVLSTSSPLLLTRAYSWYYKYILMMFTWVQDEIGKAS